MARYDKGVFFVFSAFFVLLFFAEYLPSQPTFVTNQAPELAPERMPAEIEGLRMHIRQVREIFVGGRKMNKFERKTKKKKKKKKKKASH
jgi:hypothetical protein